MASKHSVRSMSCVRNMVLICGVAIITLDNLTLSATPASVAILLNTASAMGDLHMFPV